VRRLPLRLRLTLVFALVMAVVLGATGLVVYRIFRSDLGRTIDGSLQSRSDEVAALVRHADRGLAPPLRRVSGEGDDFTQVLTPAGVVLAATPQVRGYMLLRGDALRRAAQRAVVVEHRPIRELDGDLRMRAVPVTVSGRRQIVLVGTSLGERDDSVRALALLLAAGGGVALLLSSLAGYGIASGALRPVEAMRRRAAAVSTADAGERLPVPATSDELARLGETLNEMLDRLEAAFARERTFVADASHELRTPLAILKTEIDLALRRGRSAEELRAALESAGEETDRLVQLAEDLLVIARMDQGRLPLRPADLDVEGLLLTVARRFEPRAAGEGRRVHVEDRSPTRVRGDRARLEQALGNLVDNALRHGDGDIGLAARRHDRTLELHVTDEGPGLPTDFVDRAFERFTRADGARSRGGLGLGLAIVASIAASHGGTAHAALQGGGADVWIELPAPQAECDDRTAPALSAS
jgi:two-component system, OmpR family, sensor kinase